MHFEANVRFILLSQIGRLKGVHISVVHDMLSRVIGKHEKSVRVGRGATLKPLKNTNRTRHTRAWTTDRAMHANVDWFPYFDFQKFGWHDRLIWLALPLLNTHFHTDSTLKIWLTFNSSLPKYLLCKKCFKYTFIYDGGYQHNERITTANSKKIILQKFLTLSAQITILGFLYMLHHFLKTNFSEFNT